MSSTEAKVKTWVMGARGKPIMEGGRAHKKMLRDAKAAIKLEPPPPIRQLGSTGRYSGVTVTPTPEELARVEEKLCPTKKRKPNPPTWCPDPLFGEPPRKTEAQDEQPYVGDDGKDGDDTLEGIDYDDEPSSDDDDDDDDKNMWESGSEEEEEEEEEEMDVDGATDKLLKHHGKLLMDVWRKGGDIGPLCRSLYKQF